MDNLLQNKLFLQYLSGAGGAMSSGQPVGPALDQITQQNIGAQSKDKLNKKYLEMLKQILEGGGDVKLGKDKTTINAPSVMFGGLGSELANPDYTNPGAGVKDIATSLRGEAAPQYGQVNTNRTSFVNPSASPLDDISGADLAGLTAADVSQALSGAVNVQELQEKRLTDIANMNYIGQLSKESAARVRKMETPDVPKVTAAIENYEYAKRDGFKGTFSEWEKDAKTTHQKEFDQAKAEGYKGNFQEWLRDITALGGGLSLGEKVAEHEAFADVKSKKYFTDPKGIAADVDKYVNTEEVQNKLMPLAPAKRDRETVREKENFIVSKIVSAGGKIVGSKIEGRTFVWTVKWPDGKTTEVRYAN